MKKLLSLALASCILPMSAFAETNALIEVKLFKTWVIEGELNFVNLAIKNTGTSPIRLFEDAVAFEAGQLAVGRLDKGKYVGGDMTVGLYRSYAWDEPLFELPPGETHVYEGRKFLLSLPFSEEKFVISVYLNNGFWLDSEPLTVTGVVPDSEEILATVNDGRNLHILRELVAVTYTNERWLYEKLGGGYYPVCPLSLAHKIRVEPHDGKGIYKIWDGDKPMIFDLCKSLILEDPDENNVLGKWTRERKQRAEADNTEVRRKKAEGN